METKKILFDYHIHTEFSPDSQSKMIDVIEYAISQGLKEIAITNHIEPLEEMYPYELKEYILYFEEIKNMRELYKSQINIKTGAEVSLVPNPGLEIEKRYSEFLSIFNDIDFVIGSIHSLDHKDLYNDFDFSIYTKQEAYEKYLNDILTSISKYKYSVNGHLDFISRYSNYKDPFLRYEDFSDYFDEIFKAIIKNDKGLEINTSGIKYGIKDFYPHKDILKRYKELGGEIITVGSDAHRVIEVASHFDKVYDYLKDCGFNSITTFEKMKPIQIKI